MTDPRILSIISFIFALMTAYSLYTGVRQMRDARRAGQPVRWHKNLSVLTGVEYGLLTFVFLLRTATAQGSIAPNMQSIVGPLYLLLLIPAALVAGLVIRRTLLNMRAAGQTNRAAARPPLPSRLSRKHRKIWHGQHERSRRRTSTRNASANGVRRPPPRAVVRRVKHNMNFYY